VGGFVWESVKDLAVFFEAEAFLAVAASVVDLTYLGQREREGKTHQVTAYATTSSSTTTPLHQPRTGKAVLRVKWGIRRRKGRSFAVEAMRRVRWLRDVGVEVEVVECGHSSLGRSGGCDCDLRSKGSRVPLQRHLNGHLPLRFKMNVVMTGLTVAFIAVNPRSKALAVQL
jgi:hypothetical protein